MASGTNPSEFSSIETLITSRNQNLSFFLPLILSFTSPRPESDPDHTRPGFGMVVMEAGPGSGPDSGFLGFNSLLRRFVRKDGEPPASKASIDALPSVEVESPGGECAICLEEWGVGDVAREMPCQHRFHGGCVEKWLRVHGTCPVCRFKMPVEEEDQGLDNKDGEEREIWVSFSFNGREFR